VPYFLQAEAAKQYGESQRDIERPVAAFANNINHPTVASTGSEIHSVESNNHKAAKDNDSISEGKRDNIRES
jgi:hypothetical protein